MARRLLLLPAALWFLALPVRGQIVMSAGSYSQNFNSLSNSGSSFGWTNNLTLPGWYAATNLTAAKSGMVSTYSPSAGNTASGGLYSLGEAGSADRALGSLASGGPGNLAYGVRFLNDTAEVQTNFTVSYTAEEWRVANTSLQKLTFAYQVGTALTNADAQGIQAWIPVSMLDFTSPNTNLSTSAHALAGNDQTNRVTFTNIVLAGVSVPPGQEIFLRWYDGDDPGSDDVLAIDDLTVSFSPLNCPPAITCQPRSQAANENGFAIFTVNAFGSPPPTYQWQCNGTNLPAATNSTLTLTRLSADQAGNYSVIMVNTLGVTNSDCARLLVVPTTLPATNSAVKILTYNVAGNGVADWSTNTAQAQAIGRELIYWQPDVVTFNEVPTNGVALMPDWLTVFLPGYYLATNSTSDGFIQNCIASRWPIIRSQSWLKFSSLAAFGYTNSLFTRDLFEAQIRVPNWPLPLHAFVVHLKSTGTGNPQDDADKRAAMAAAVSNFFATVYLAGTNATHPYVLSGDMNEDDFWPDRAYNSGLPIHRLVSRPTGLQMTVPVNPVTLTDLTESIQGTLDKRFDYILPCGLLFSNLAGMQVFRTDLLTNYPPNLYSNDDKSASDHLPVLLVFNNPFDTPFKLLSATRTNQNLTLQWESQCNRSFSIETSTNLTDWTPLVTNLATCTTNSPLVFTTNTGSDPSKFFRIYRAP
jgi:endonuclease/exonuclease/phosphatase family metal-dependent hydrolase